MDNDIYNKMITIIIIMMINHDIYEYDEDIVKILYLYIE
jgi:hypothetical protein